MSQYTVGSVTIKSQKLLSTQMHVTINNYVSKYVWYEIKLLNFCLYVKENFKKAVKSPCLYVSLCFHFKKQCFNEYFFSFFTVSFEKNVLYKVKTSSQYKNQKILQWLKLSKWDCYHWHIRVPTLIWK